MPDMNKGNDSQQSTTDKLSAKASEAASTVSAKARDTANAAASEARTRAEGAKSGVAEEVSSVASALRTAAGELREGSPQERTFAQIADGLADASETIRNKDLGELATDVSDFARRNPMIFLGGAALLGFAASRFAKASSHRQPQYGTARNLPTASTGTPYGASSTHRPAGGPAGNPASSPSTGSATTSVRPAAPAVSTTTGVSPKGTQS